MSGDNLSQIVDLLTVEVEERPDPFLESIRNLIVGIAMKRAELDADYLIEASA